MTKRRPLTTHLAVSPPTSYLWRQLPPMTTAAAAHPLHPSSRAVVRVARSEKQSFSESSSICYLSALHAHRPESEKSKKRRKVRRLEKKLGDEQPWPAKRTRANVTLRRRRRELFLLRAHDNAWRNTRLSKHPLCSLCLPSPSLVLPSEPRTESILAFLNFSLFSFFFFFFFFLCKCVHRERARDKQPLAWPCRSSRPCNNAEARLPRLRLASHAPPAYARSATFYREWYGHPPQERRRIRNHLSAYGYRSPSPSSLGH